MGGRGAGRGDGQRGREAGWYKGQAHRWILHYQVQGYGCVFVPPGLTVQIFTIFFRLVRSVLWPLVSVGWCLSA